MLWCKTSASVSGVRHRKNGEKCQDASMCEKIDDIIIGAISDGMGSSRYSEIAAQKAVDGSIKFLEHWWKIRKEKQHLIKINKLSKDDIDFYKIFDNIRFAIECYAEDHNHQLHDYDCTWLTFVITPECIAFAHVGDGFIVVRESGSQSYKNITDSFKNKVYINGTDSLMKYKKPDELKVSILKSSCEFFCAGTDGVELACLEYPSGIPFHPWFEHFEEFIHHNMETNSILCETKIEISLKDFLQSPIIEDHTDDDCTLMFGCKL